MDRRQTIWVLPLWNKNNGFKNQYEENQYGSWDETKEMDLYILMVAYNLIKLSGERYLPENWLVICNG